MCLTLIGLVNVWIIYETSWSFIDYTLILICVNLFLLSFIFSQVSSSLKKMFESIIMRELDGSEFVRFLYSSLALGFFLFFFIRRIYYLASYIGFYTLSIILCITIIFSLSILLFRNRSVFEGIKKKEKVLIVSFQLACFLIPLVAGVIIPVLSDPIVNVSTMPGRVFFESGQFQHVADLDLKIKAVQGYAWNINITVEAPSSFDIWFEGIESGKKEIAFMEVDQVIESSLEIQPSNIVENGTYSIQIEWSYESANGYLTRKTKEIPIFIGSFLFDDITLNIILYMFVFLILILIPLFIYLTERDSKLKAQKHT